MGIIRIGDIDFQHHNQPSLVTPVEQRLFTFGAFGLLESEADGENDDSG